MFSEQNKQLADESQRMEERLRTLKEMMKKEKAKRESNSGAFWQSGQKGALLKYADAASTKATTPLKSSTKVQILTDKNEDTKPPNSPSAKKGNYCIQCCKKTHTLTRTKAGVPVCKECHAKLTAIVKTKQPRTEGDAMLESKFSSAKPNTEAAANGGSLLDGTYDEEANATAFAEALAEWRNSGGHNKVDTISTNSTSGNSASCQTVDSKEGTNLTPEFHTSGSVTYLERLMIRRNRYDPKFLQNTVTVQKSSISTAPTLTSTTPSREDTEDTALPTPYNVFYEAPPEHWSTPCSDDSNISTFTTNTPKPKSNIDLNNRHDLDHRHTSTGIVKPMAMQVAIREAWASKEGSGNLSHFFLSGVDKDGAVTCDSECQDDESSQEVILGCTTRIWKPEQSVVRDQNSCKSHNEDDSDSDDSNDSLDLANCESDKEEWEMDDRMTLECLERELQASQLGNNPEQEHQEINSHSSDFEDTEREPQKDDQ